MTVTRRAAAAVLVLALVASIGPLSTARGADSSCWEYSGAELRAAARLNRIRKANDLGALSLDPELSRVARSHTKQMVARRALFHSAPDKLGERVTNWLVLGENVGAGGSVRGVVKRMMSSADHAANVLGPSFEHIGIGTRHARGRIWMTVAFEARRDPGTTLWMPRC